MTYHFLLLTSVISIGSSRDVALRYRYCWLLQIYNTVYIIKKFKMLYRYFQYCWLLIKVITLGYWYILQIVKHILALAYLGFSQGASLIVHPLRLEPDITSFINTTRPSWRPTRYILYQRVYLQYTYSKQDITVGNTSTFQKWKI